MSPVSPRNLGGNFNHPELNLRATPQTPRYALLAMIQRPGVPHVISTRRATPNQLPES
jgi:hypothetical protein